MAVQTQQQLLDAIAADIADNTSGDISPQDVRDILRDSVESLAFRTALAMINSAAAATARAEKITVDGTTYSLPDDVVDVTDTGLPTLTEENHKQLFIDHDTPRVWVGHREVTAGTAAQGTFTNYSATNYQGALPLNGFSPPNVQAGWFWYDTGLHAWVRARSDTIPVTVAFSTLFPDSDWLGEQPDDATAVGLIDSFDTSRSYYFYDSGTNRVRVLTNSTYVAAVAREVHYSAEPISAPNVVGTITGITAGNGLTGGGSSGQVSVSLDVDSLDARPSLEGGDAFPFANVSDSNNVTDKVTLANLAAALAGANLTAQPDGSIDAVAGMGGGGGFQLRSGNGVPSNALGADGDWYIDVLGNSFFERASGSYVARLDLGGSVHIATATLNTGTGQLTLTTMEDVHLEDLVIFEIPGSILASQNLQARVGTGGTLEPVNLTDGTQAALNLRSGQTMCLLRNASSWTMVLPDRTTFRASDVQIDNSSLGHITADDLQSGIEELDTAIHTDAQINALIQAALAAAVTGNTETGITVTHNSDGTLDFVVGTVQAHTNYIAISADSTFAAGEFTASATGNSSTTPSLVVPTFSGVTRFIGIAVPDVEGDITDITQGGVSTFGAWARVTGTIQIGGEAHKVWRTTDAQNDLASGITYVIAQA